MAEIRSRSLSKEGLDNFDRIFGKPKPKIVVHKWADLKKSREKQDKTNER